MDNEQFVVDNNKSTHSPNCSSYFLEWNKSREREREHCAACQILPRFVSTDWSPKSSASRWYQNLAPDYSNEMFVATEATNFTCRNC